MEGRAEDFRDGGAEVAGTAGCRPEDGDPGSDHRLASAASLIFVSVVAGVIASGSIFT